MVKIISDVPHASVIKQTICKNCGCTLEYTPNDIKERIETDYTGYKDTYCVIECPKCNNNIRV